MREEAAGKPRLFVVNGYNNYIHTFLIVYYMEK